MFDRYRSPDNEVSLFKGIPMDERESAFVKGMLAVGCTVRYRGSSTPKYRRSQDYCHRKHAETFAIYPPTQRENLWPWQIKKGVK